MAQATAHVGNTPEGRKIMRHTNTSAADTLASVSVAGSERGRRFLHATVKYSAAPTQAGVTTVLDSGAGAAYDAQLNAGSANAQVTVYKPDNGLVLGKDDAIVVTAPAGGGVITSSIAVYTEE